MGKRISAFSILRNESVIFKKNYNHSKYCFATILTVISMCLQTIDSNPETEFTVCKTKSCLQSTVSLINCMNESVDPCEDFYEYACGMFENNYPSYYNADANSWFSIISLKVKYMVKKLLTKNDEKHEPEAVHKVRKFYKYCLTATTIDYDDNGKESLWNVLIKAGLPKDYLSDSVPLEIEKTIAKINAYFKTGLFIDVNIDNDPGNLTSHLVIARSREFEFFNNRNNIKTNHVTIENDNFPPIYNKNFKEIVDKLSNYNQIHFKRLYADDLIKLKLRDFELEYGKILQNASDYKNHNIPETFTLGQLQNLTDSVGNTKFNWSVYLGEVFRDINPTVYKQLSSENSDDYEILISNRNYINDVLILLSKTSTTIIKLSILKSVFGIWEHNYPTLKSTNPDECVSLTIKLFGMVAGYSMINTWNKSFKDELTEMSDNIKWAFRKMVNEVTWIDDETKNATLRKLANTITLLGYPDDYIDILNNSFQDLEITENHWKNVMSIEEYNNNTRYLVDEKYNTYENIMWSRIINEVNALDLPWRNAFFLPVAIIQTPFYHNGIQALNYGAIGSTIGHEMSHNYDTIGRMYNEYGEKVQWWSDKSYEEYMKRAECLVEHYNNVTVVSHNKTFKINGRRTMNENIADIIGLKEAYFAYQRYVDVHGQEPRLPGLEQYSPEQLFFLGYANHYCSYDKNDVQLGNLLTVHSPLMVRVREVLSLSPEFARAWSCPLGSPMNPDKTRCQLW